MRVYLIRHGQSSENARGLHHRLSYTEFNAFLCEAQNVPLTDLGIQQTHQAGLALSGRSIERLYTSPFVRASMTAAILGQALHLTPETLPDLREVMPLPLPPSHHAERVSLLYLRGYLTYPSWSDVYRRARRVWHDVTRPPATAVALVSHFAFIHVLLAVQWRYPVRSYHLNNGGITLLDFPAKRK